MIKKHILKGLPFTTNFYFVLDSFGIDFAKGQMGVMNGKTNSKAILG